MKFFLTGKKIVAFVLSVLLLVSVAVVPASAEDAEITESSTYVLNRDANGDTLFQYQSPCKIGYDFNNQYNGASIPIQAYIFTMYNSITGEHFPTYCCDINVTAVQGANYRRLNLEDSAISAGAAGKLRAILQEGFYIVPISGESDADHAARVAARTAALAEASGAEGLTTGEAIAATQCAIWRIVHGPELAFPKYCRSVFKPTFTKYVALCSYDELRTKNLDLINKTIETAYNYLISLDPIEGTEKTVAPSSFVDLNDPVYTENADGSYNIAVTTTVDVEMVQGDSLTLKAKLGDTYTTSVSLEEGTHEITLTLSNVPASLISEEVKLSISGYQTSVGYFLFDSTGNRQESQSMIGYSNSRLPVYAEVVAKDERILNIYKSTKIKIGENKYESMPLGGISFDLHFLATMEEYQTGAVVLPENAADYEIPNSLPEYTLTTDEDGRVSINLLHHGLPDGVYLLVEHQHPNIVAPIAPQYVYVPSEDRDTGEIIYNVTVKPKNEVKGGVRIEKDVISVGNEEASVNAYEAHTWIIGATIPSDILSGKSYTITDTLDNRLDYLGNLSVVLENKSDNTTVDLIADTDYKLTVTDVDSLSEGSPSDSFAVDLTTNGITKIAGAIGSNSFEDYMLRVYFDAQINANAEMGTTIPNRAELTYVNSIGFKYAVKSDIPVVYTGGFKLLKTDAKDESKTLAGAVFELYRYATLEEIGADDPRITEIAGVSGSVIQLSFYDGPVTQGEKVNSVTTGEDGKISISGLAYGSYFLVEKKAPAGYNSLPEAFEITVDSSSHMEENAINVKNESGTVLPNTGGSGTGIYVVGGILIMCLAAAFLLYNNKRRNADA